MAILFGFWGLLAPNPFLIFIALFVWLGAEAEASMAQMRSAVDGIPVMHAMITNFETLHPEDPVSRAVELLRAGFHADFPVVDDDGRLVGVLTRRDLAAALGRHGADARVADVMQRDFVTAEPRDMLYTALVRLQECGCRTLPVVEDGRLVGIVTADNLAEVLMIQDTLRRRRRVHPGLVRSDRPELPGRPIRVGEHSTAGRAVHDGPGRT
jgi:CBS domain-containing protein